MTFDGNLHLYGTKAKKGALKVRMISVPFCIFALLCSSLFRMKTINLILSAVIAAALVLVACDNKDKEAEAARLKHIADSLKQDSIRRAEEAANAARLADSARIADSLAAAKTGKPSPGGKTVKPTTKPTQPAPAAPATQTDPKQGKMSGQGTQQTTETKQQKMGGDAPAASTTTKKQKMGGN